MEPYSINIQPEDATATRIQPESAALLATLGPRWRVLKWHDWDAEDGDATEKEAAVVDVVRHRTSIV